MLAVMSKQLSVCVIIALIGLALAPSPVTEQAKEECRQQTGLSKEDSRILKSNEVLSDKKKCYIKCLFEKGGYIGNDGKVIVEKMKSDEIADGDEGKLQKLYECVGKVKNIENCDRITELIDCFML